jgi:hypothetical protein
MTIVPDKMISGPPMSPSQVQARGTSCVRYIMYPRINPFPKPTTQPGPRMNVQPATIYRDDPDRAAYLGTPKEAAPARLIVR